MKAEEEITEMEAKIEIENSDIVQDLDDNPPMTEEN